MTDLHPLRVLARLTRDILAPWTTEVIPKGSVVEVERELVPIHPAKHAYFQILAPQGHRIVVCDADLDPDLQMSPNGDTPGVMTMDISERLASLEAVVWRGLEDAGRALREIRDAKLYRERYTTFETYVERHFGISRSHAYRLIRADVVREHLGKAADGLREMTLRELAPLANVDAHAAAQLARELQGEQQITAETVRLAVQARLNERWQARGDESPVSVLAVERPEAPSDQGLHGRQAR